MKKILFLLAILSVALTSCLKDEAYVNPPAVTVLPLSIIPDNDVVIAADITPDAEGATIQSVMITYTANGVSTTGEMTLDVAPKYIYTIPAAVNTDGAVVKYLIVVKASNGKVRYKDGNYMVSNIDYTPLVLNEVGGTDGNKFVEIFNNGTEAIPLAGVVVWKNNAVYATIKSGNSIPAKGFATIGADGVQTFLNNVTVNETTGGMSAKKGVLVELKTPSGSLLSTFARGTIDAGISAVTGSYARIPDGAGDFKVAVPSPGAANPTSGGEDIPQS